MHDVPKLLTFGCNPQINVCVIFGLKAFIHWVSCERNSSYNFSRIFLFLKLCRCYCRGLKMCMTFGCNPGIDFVTFFADSTESF